MPVTYDFDPADLKQKPESYFKDPVCCPKCQGHGGGITKRDAYGNGRHFKWHCDNCNGWGWVEAGSKDATCVHEYKEVEAVGRCLHLYKCEKCGKEQVVDSSD